MPRDGAVDAHKSSRRARNRIADRVWITVPQATEWQQAGN